ncbi:hypothetical protein HaLaN_06184, partial [Haematococcus lacustris]
MPPRLQGGSLSTPDPGAILSHTFEDDLGAGPLTYLATGQLLRRSTPLVAGSGGQVGSLAQRCAVLAWLLEPSQRELW